MRLDAPTSAEAPSHQLARRSGIPRPEFPERTEPTESMGHSQIRTVVHEAFHADGRDPDVGYWGPTCRGYAKNAPSTALDNADNYQLYVRDVWFDGLEP